MKKREELTFSPDLDKRSGKLFDNTEEIATVFFWTDQGYEKFDAILEDAWKYRDLANS